jgi:hypothetical protein
MNMLVVLRVVKKIRVSSLKPLEKYPASGDPPANWVRGPTTRHRPPLLPILVIFDPRRSSTTTNV